MGVLAFGDSSTWALKREGSTRREGFLSAKASRAARFGDGTLPRRQGNDADGTARRGASASADASGASAILPAGVTPRNAWPEGTFTITYPRGYDPARGRFVRDGEGDADARVRVKKEKTNPARARMDAEASTRAASAAREAASVLDLGEAYLEKVREQRETRRALLEAKRKSVLGVTKKAMNSAGAVGKTKIETPAEDAFAAYAALYARRAAERDAERARVAAGRAAAAKRDAASARMRGGGGKGKKRRGASS